MERPSTKWIFLCLGLAVVASIFWFCLWIHKTKKEIINKNGYFIDIPMIFDNVKHKKHKINDIDDIFDDFDNMFEDMKKEQDKKMKRFRDDFWENYDMESHLEDLTLTGDFDSRGTFKYYEKKNINWNKSSYNIDWNWGQWTGDWIISINWKNKNWIKFYFSWTIDNWKVKWTISNENWNKKFINLEKLDISTLEEISNNL